MKKIIWILILWLVLMFFLFHCSYETIKTRIPIEAFIEPPVALAETPTTILTAKTDIDTISIQVSLKTGYKAKTIKKIILAESGGDPKVIHVNKNGTKDYGLFQINSIHLKEAKEMSLDLLNPNDNAEFAIHLIKNEGLFPWSASKDNWKDI
jgi:hypothetical protein